MKSTYIIVFGKAISGTIFLFLTAGKLSAQPPSALVDTASSRQTLPPSDKSSALPAFAAMSKGTIKYLGAQDDMIVFDVSYPNPDGSKFVVTVKDQDGTQLYQGSFSDRSFYKQFRMPKNDKDRIIFMLHDGKEPDLVKTFEVNVNSRFVQEVAVKKL